jgi:hypothetical protein
MSNTPVAASLDEKVRLEFQLSNVPVTETDASTENLIALFWGVIWNTGGASALPATGNRKQSSTTRANHGIGRELCCDMIYPDD